MQQDKLCQAENSPTGRNEISLPLNPFLRSNKKKDYQT
jgi:hypothetical protein